VVTTSSYLGFCGFLCLFSVLRNFRLVAVVIVYLITITVTHHIYVIHSDQSSKCLETLLRDCRVLTLNLIFLHNLFKPQSLLYLMVQVSYP